jgi:hypothetical protein
MRDFKDDFINKWNVKDERIMKDIIMQYHEIYCTESDHGKLYGRSSEDLLEKIAPIIFKENPKSIMDFGCGRSSLINYFWKDGNRKLTKYDPAIREHKKLVVEHHDIVLCTDVFEHIPEIYLGGMIKTLHEISSKAIITVSLIPARKKLPNGWNAHITIRPPEFWTDLIGLYYKKINIIEQDKNGIFLKTW